MAVKQYKPTTPGRRNMTNQDFSMVTRNKPMKSLLSVKNNTAGRNNQGKITSRRRQGTKRFLRDVTYVLPADTNAEVIGIEYDPNRSARIALIKDQNEKHFYVIAGNKFTVGQKIVSGPDAPIEAGNHLPLSNIPAGTFVYNIQLSVGGKGQLVRTAGTKAQLVAKEGEYGQVRLPSGEVRMVNLNCYATIGAIGNEQHQNIKWGSAGRNRHRGKRPSVKGRAMNAADHPMGGGDGGKGSLGGHPMTPWGKKALGLKTRKRKSTSKYIVRSRHAAKRK